MTRRLVSLRGITLLAAGGGLLALAVAGSDLANSALRAAAVVALAGAACLALRRRRDDATPPLVTVAERLALGRETGVAVLTVPEGRRILVGYGPGGVALLHELGRPHEALP